MDIQLKRGLLDVCVLAAIKNEESYGYKIIKDSKYTVITSMVKDRSCTRTKYHTEYKLRVIYPNNEESVHIVSGFTYRKAKTGMTALIVNYSSDGAEQSKIPVDVVIADSE